MEHNNFQKNYDRMKKISKIPSKIIQHHGRENVTEFVLHDLASKNCFNFSKASYFVDNPDFDHLKGVAGYTDSQAFEHGDKIWEHPELFTNHMAGAPFNKKVRTVLRPSPKRGCLEAQKIVDVVAQELDMNKPQFFCWDMKHYNHGLFVFECQEAIDWEHDELLNALHLLSLCPIF